MPLGVNDQGLKKFIIIIIIIAVVAVIVVVISICIINICIADQRKACRQKHVIAMDSYFCENVLKTKTALHLWRVTDRL